MGYWERIEEGLGMWRLDYPLSGDTDDPARMATCLAIEMGAGELMLISPPKHRKDDAIYEELGRLGEVVAIVPPCGFHRAGLPKAMALYPEATFYFDPRIEARIKKVCPGLKGWSPLSTLQERLPTSMEIFVPPHLKRPDTILRVRLEHGYLWYVNDLMTNFPAFPRNPWQRLLTKALQFKVGLAVNILGGRIALVKDRKAFSDWFVQELLAHPPVVWVPGHGPVIREQAVLSNVAAMARGF